MNAVFLQVRSSSDALYKSELVPWSSYLTGTFGKDPSFDPLKYAIDEAHKRNLELHAWFNPYRVSMNISDTTKASLNIANSVYKQHPEWIRIANNRFVVDPGIPAARQWVEDCVMEVVNNYDIDGVHFDDYFYYESVTNEMGDDTTYQKYNNGQFVSKADWRRNNTYLLIKELSAKISSAKRWVKFGVSPSSIWRNKKDDPAGSNTNSSYTNYDKCYADTKKWVDVGQNIAWAIDHVDKLYENNIISGDGKGNFLPNNNTIRGDFMLMLMRSLKLETDFNSNFSDVPNTSYYYNAIGTAKSLGITSGTGQGSFQPTSNISRQDMMVQVYKALKFAGIPLATADVSELDKYSDAAQISDYAKEAIASLTKNGYASGTGKGISPKGLTTRAEIAAILSKFIW